MSDTATRFLQWWSYLQQSHVYQIVRNVSMILGATVLATSISKEVWTFARGLHAYILAPKGIGNMNLKKYGPWAVVTGASDGIGKGYALELARQGLNVVIISRSGEKLQLVANEIESLYNKKVRIIVADFSSGQDVYLQIEQQLQDLDIGILINNVGLSYTYPDYFLAVTKERHRNVVEVNCQTVVQMTHMLLPSMLTRKRGVIVNLSSISDIVPCPLLVTYTATKKFICYFSDALRQEYGSQGIIVQVASPGMVATAMSNVRRATYHSPHPIVYARSAVATIGLLDYTQGYWYHSLLSHLRRKFPMSAHKYLTKRYLEEARRKLKKREKEGTLIVQMRQSN